MLQPTQSESLTPAVGSCFSSANFEPGSGGWMPGQSETATASPRSGQVLPIGAILSRLLRDYDLALPSEAATPPMA